jgi:hypothetical protein
MGGQMWNPDSHSLNLFSRKNSHMLSTFVPRGCNFNIYDNIYWERVENMLDFFPLERFRNLLNLAFGELNFWELLEML